MLNYHFDAGWFSVNNHSNIWTMKISEIKELTVTELNKKFRELGDELLQLQIRKQTGQVEKPHLIKSIRRDRAKILTTLSANKAQSA